MERKLIRSFECPLCGMEYQAGRRGPAAGTCPDCAALWRALSALNDDLPGLMGRIVSEKREALYLAIRGHANRIQPRDPRTGRLVRIRG